MEGCHLRDVQRNKNLKRLRKRDQRDRSRKGKVTVSYKQKEEKAKKNGIFKNVICNNRQVK